jgi:hypothetical protein
MSSVVLARYEINIGHSRRLRNSRPYRSSIFGSVIFVEGDRSTCARSTVGKPSPPSRSISQLISLHDPLPQATGDHVTPNSNTNCDGTFVSRNGVSVCSLRYINGADDVCLLSLKSLSGGGGMHGAMWPRGLRWRDRPERRMHPAKPSSREAPHARWRRGARPLGREGGDRHDTHPHPLSCRARRLRSKSRGRGDPDARRCPRRSRGCPTGRRIPRMRHVEGGNRSADRGGCTGGVRPARRCSSCFREASTFPRKTGNPS